MTSSRAASLLSNHLFQGYVFALVTASLWTGFVILGRLADSTSLNPFDLTALRFSVATIFLLPLWWFRYRFPIFNQRFLVLACVGGVGYALSAYSGLSLAPATHGAVLLYGVLPFFMTLAAWLLLSEKSTIARLRALAVIAAGVMCMLAYGWHSIRTSWHGDVILIVASAFWAFYTVLVKRWGFAPMHVTMGVALLAALFYLPVYLLWLPKEITGASVQTLIVQGVFHGILVVIVAMWLFMQAMVRLGPTRLGSVMAIVPALVGLAAVVVLHEEFSLLLLAGLLFTSLGAWLGARSS